MTTKEERNARARDNQRLSRARRLDYIAALEERIRQYEKHGVEATQEMQASARAVEKQNILLKAWVCKGLQIRDSDLQEWLRLPAERAEKAFNVHLLSRAMNNTQFASSQETGFFPQYSGEFGQPPTSASISYASESSFSDTPFTPQMHMGDSQYPPTTYRYTPAIKSNSNNNIPYANPARMQSLPNNQYSPYQPQQAPPRRATVQSSRELAQLHRSQSAATRDGSMSTHSDTATAPWFVEDQAKSIQSGSSPDVYQQLQSQVTPRSIQNYTSYPTSVLPNAPLDTRATSNWLLDTPSFNVNNLMSLVHNAESSSYVVDCGTDLGPIGQQFCNLLTLLVPDTFCSSSQNSNIPHMTCRESYAALQHLLGDKMSVEDVVAKLIASARPTDSIDCSLIDTNAVRAILESVGSEHLA